MKWELFSCEFWMVRPLFYHFVVKNFERSGPIFYRFVLEKFGRPSPLFYHFGEENFEIGGKFKNCIFCFKEKMKNTGTSILNCCDLKWSEISNHDHEKCEPWSITFVICQSLFNMIRWLWSDWQWSPITFIHQYLWRLYP